MSKPVMENMQPAHEVRSIDVEQGSLDVLVGGSGSPVLYLHPAGGIRWTAVHAALARAHTVYAPVAPGFDGRALHPAASSVQTLAALYGRLCDQLIGAPCDVIGHSFGGWVAAWLAVQRPDCVEQLVLSAAAGFRPTDAPAMPATPEAFARALYRHPEHLTDTPKLPDTDAANRAQYLKYNGGMTRDEALIARLPEIDRLTMIVHGTHDGIIPDSSSQQLRRWIRRSYLMYLWDAGHGLEVDQPERMSELLLSFFARSEAFMVNWGKAT